MKTPVTANRFMFFLLIYLFFLPYIIIISMTMMFPESNLSDNFALVNIIANALISVLGFFVPIVVYCMLKCENLKDVIPHKKLSFKSIFILLIMSFFLQPITAFFSSISTLFVENNVETYFDEVGSLPFWVKTLFIAIFPAVFEELMFRGFILNGYKKAKVWKIALVSGLFFGLMHLDINQMSYAIPVGAFFAILVYYSGSIYSSMILHFIINFTSVCVSHIASFFYDSADLVQEPSTFAENLEYVYTQAGVAFFAAFILFFLTKYFISINKDNSIKAEIKKNNEALNNYINSTYYNYNIYHNITINNNSNTSETKVFTFSFFAVIAVSAIIMLINAYL